MPPTVTRIGVGATDAGGAWSYDVGGNTNDADNGTLLILQIVQDGASAAAVAVTSVGAGISNLAGTTSAITTLCTDQPIGSATAAFQHLYIGRMMNNATAGLISGSNSATDDIYMNIYCITDASLGTTLATVIENSTAGSFVNGAGTSASVLDTGVTTLGPDRLACNFVGINDDASGLASFAGETGGDWTLEAIYETATGTDATAALMTAPMVSAGTINGGSDAITSLAWGVIGFALIPVSAAATSLIYQPAPPSLYGR